MTTWNGNTVRAGKLLAITVGIFALFAVSAGMRWNIGGHILSALCAILACATTYHGVAAMRCKLAAKKDFWAGFAIFLIGGAIGIISIVSLWNELQNRLY